MPPDDVPSDAPPPDAPPAAGKAGGGKAGEAGEAGEAALPPRCAGSGALRSGESALSMQSTVPRLRGG